jgi:hypothetical protein
MILRPPVKLLTLIANLEGTIQVYQDVRLRYQFPHLGDEGVFLGYLMGVVAMLTQSIRER